MATITAFPVRIKFDVPGLIGAKDVRLGAFATVPRGNTTDFEVGVYLGDSPLDLSNIASLRLEIRLGRTSGAVLTAAVDVLQVDMDPVITGASWMDGSAQHATFRFTAAQMNQNLQGGERREFTLVLSGLTTPGGEVITFGITTLVVVEDVTGSTEEPPEVTDEWYTAAQVDALLAMRAPLVHTHLRADISDASAFGRARMADADAAAAKAALALVKADVGLANADNTSDANKPVSTAQAAAIAAAQAACAPASHTHTRAEISDATPFGRARMADADAAAAKAALSLVKGDVGLANADNTSDASKPVSTAQAAALALKMDKTANLSDVANAATAFGNIKQAASEAATGVVELATQAEVDAGTDALRVLTPATAARLLAAMRNAMAPSGAISIAGRGQTVGAYSNIGASVVGTSKFTLYAVVGLCTDLGFYQSLLFFGPNSSNHGASTFAVSIAPGGIVSVDLYNASATGRRNASFSLAAFAGKKVHLAFVRDGAALRVYVNCILQSLTESGIGTTPPADWSATVDSSALMIGRRSGESFVGLFYRVSAYNLAFTAADALETYENGGVPPVRLRYAGVSPDYSSDFSVDQDGWNLGVDGSTGTITANHDSINGSDNWLKLHNTGATNANPLYMYPGSGRPAVPNIGAGFGKRVRVTFTVYNPVGSGLTHFGIYTQHGSVQGGVAQTIAEGEERTWSDEFVLDGTGAPGARWGVRAGNGAVSSGAPPGSNYYIKNVKWETLGALLELDGDDDGIGYQWHDRSRNKLDALLSITGLNGSSGVAWTKPQRRGFVRTPGTGQTWTATHEGKSWLGQRALPPGAVPTLLTLTSTAATSGSGAKVGTTNSSTRWSADAALSANTRSKRTLANELPAGVADNDHDIVTDPDSANFTGTIYGEMHYVVTEGTP